MDPTEALHHKIVSVVESCQPFMRSALYANIVLSGVVPRSLPTRETICLTTLTGPVA
jgi:hypothetical protein